MRPHADCLSHGDTIYPFYNLQEPDPDLLPSDGKDVLNLNVSQFYPFTIGFWVESSLGWLIFEPTVVGTAQHRLPKLVESPLSLATSKCH